jgi:hypothetical protein
VAFAPKFIRIITTYIFIVLAWILFRANSISDAYLIILKIVTDQGQLYIGEGIPSLLLPLMMITILLIKEIKDEYHIPLALMHNHNPWISIPASALIIATILLCAEFNSGQFIYFQF